MSAPTAAAALGPSQELHGLWEPAATADAGFPPLFELVNHAQQWAVRSWHEAVCLLLGGPAEAAWWMQLHLRGASAPAVAWGPRPSSKDVFAAAGARVAEDGRLSPVAPPGGAAPQVRCPLTDADYLAARVDAEQRYLLRQKSATERRQAPAMHEMH